MFGMRRREFIMLLGGVAAAWPVAARAQTGKLVRLGYLEGGARADSTVQNLRRQFVLGMRDLGYNEGRDYLLEERYAAGQLDSFPNGCVVSWNTRSSRGCKNARRSSPIGR
jgi:putative ABC transport system substrate-binding protein